MLRAAALLLALIVFAACSGDDSGDTSPTATQPSATSAPPAASSAATRSPSASPVLEAYDVPDGSHPHDVAPATDGGVWYTAQATGKLGWLNPQTGEVRETPLGNGSNPHGVIVGPDGAPWITDSGLNAIVRVDADTLEVRTFPLPEDRPAVALNTAAFDANGMLWFTGQNGGIVGRLDPGNGEMQLFAAPRGAGPYGITATSDTVYFASLAGSYVGRVDPATGEITVLEPPTADQGARRVWAGPDGRIWVSEWNAGQVGVYDPTTGRWREWPLPGDGPQAYSVYADESGIWLSDFRANAIVRFDPETETFESFALPDTPGEVRQLLGRPGEVWGAESAADRIVVIRY